MHKNNILCPPPLFHSTVLLLILQGFEVLQYTAFFLTELFLGEILIFSFKNPFTKISICVEDPGCACMHAYKQTMLCKTIQVVKKL